MKTMVFLVSLILSTYWTVPKPRQTAISTCWHNGTFLSIYWYVDISVRRHWGTARTKQTKGYYKTGQLFYYKRGKGYHKTRQVLRNGAINTKRALTNVYHIFAAFTYCVLGTTAPLWWIRVSTISVFPSFKPKHIQYSCTKIGWRQVNCTWPLDHWTCPPRKHYFC